MLGMTELRLVRILQAITDDVDHDRIAAIVEINDVLYKEKHELTRQLHNAWKCNKDQREDIFILQAKLDEALVELKDMRLNRDHFYNLLNEKRKTHKARFAENESLQDEVGRLESNVKGYQDSQRIYIEDAAILRKDNVLRVAEVKDLEERHEILNTNYTNVLENWKAADSQSDSWFTKYSREHDAWEKLDQKVSEQASELFTLQSEIKRLEDIVETLDNPSLPDEPADHSDPLLLRINRLEGDLEARNNTISELYDQLRNPIEPIDHGPEPTH